MSAHWWTLFEPKSQEPHPGERLVCGHSGFLQPGADASVAATRTNPAQFGANLPAGVSFDTEQTAYAANLTAAWDLDLFGRLRARERAALARVDAATASAAAVRNALLAEIAATVIDWRTIEARLDSVAQDLKAAEQLADLAGERERAGRHACA